MRKIGIVLLLSFIAAVNVVVAQTEGPMPMKPEMTEIWDPEVRVVTPGSTPMEAPSDAIILFDGNDLEKEWTSGNNGKPGWKVENGAVTVQRGAGGIKTKRVFEDFQLHIEWRSPEEVKGTSQGRGNSGVFPQDRYKIQVLDSYN